MAGSSAPSEQGWVLLEAESWWLRAPRVLLQSEGAVRPAVQAVGLGEGQALGPPGMQVRGGTHFRGAVRLWSWAQGLDLCSQGHHCP